VQVPKESSAAAWFDDIVEVCEPDDEERGFVYVAWERFRSSGRIAVPASALRPLTPLACELLRLANG
jgi:hypothetical protein